MSKRQVVIILGVWIMAFLFLGFPAGLDKGIALVSGIILIITAYSLKPEARWSDKDGAVPYVEHKTETVERTNEITSGNNLSD